MDENIRFVKVFDHATKRWVEVPTDTKNQKRFEIDKKKWIARRRYKGDVSKLKTKSFLTGLKKRNGYLDDR